MINNIIPEDVINHIISFLSKCEICDIYYIKNDLQQCVRCNKIWCDKCNSNCRYINWIYFKIHLPICHRCYNDLLTTSFIRYHV